MSYNTRTVKVGTINLLDASGNPQTSPQYLDLVRGMLNFSFEFVLNCNVTVSGGTTDGTLLDETPHNILSMVGIVQDDDYWPLDHLTGRDLARMQPYLLNRPPYFTTFADGSAATTQLTAQYRVPFKLGGLQDSNTTIGFFPPVTSSFQAAVQPIGTINYATFFSGGDRVLAVNSLSVDVYQHFAITPQSYRPTLLPRYVTSTSPNVSATNAEFQSLIQTEPLQRIAMLFATPTRNGICVDDIVNSISFKNSNTIFYNLITPSVFQTLAERFYPGLDPATVGSVQTSTSDRTPKGIVVYNYTVDISADRYGLGRRGGAVDMRAGNGYQFTYDVTHTSDTEVIRYVKLVLESKPGWTLE